MNGISSILNGGASDDDTECEPKRQSCACPLVHLSPGKRREREGHKRAACKSPACPLVTCFYFSLFLLHAALFCGFSPLLANSTVLSWVFSSCGIAPLSPKSSIVILFRMPTLGRMQVSTFLFIHQCSPFHLLWWMVEFVVQLVIALLATLAQKVPVMLLVYFRYYW